MPASPRRRALGQHFLHDQKVITRIVTTTFELVKKFGAHGLLEIGPGKGAITTPLLAAAIEVPSLENFRIVEKDRYLAAEWVEQAKNSSNVEVIESDFLALEASTYLDHTPLIVVSNLPYSAGTAILQELAQHPSLIPAMVLMFQAEVAARLRAHPREKAWGSLSLWIQNRWDVKTLLAVPPSAFSPPPDVNSEIVVLEARSKLRISCPVCPNPEFTEKWISAWDENWEKLIRIPFLHRRKMLRSGLPKDSVWKEALERAGIDGTRRAEELDWNDWEKWLTALQTLTFKFNHS